MDIRTYRARSLQDAIELVRQDLGPDASVLHTREVKSGALGWVGRGRQIEVTASSAIAAPSRFSEGSHQSKLAISSVASVATNADIPSHEHSPSMPNEHVFEPSAPVDAETPQRGYEVANHPPAPSAPADQSPRMDAMYSRDRGREQLAIPSLFCPEPEFTESPTNPRQAEPTDVSDDARDADGIDAEPPRPILFGTSVARLRLPPAERKAAQCPQGAESDAADAADADPASVGSNEQWTMLRREFCDSLRRANLRADIADELIDRLEQNEAEDLDFAEGRLLLSDMVEAELHVAGGLSMSFDRPRVVALVGPTGVGKTTTIAKLAANFRLREGRSVGLIAVDTYRIAAVDQLQTYADIIDVPLKVGATLREMRAAIDSMAEMDLILLDTAGRSPKDTVKIRELGALLTEARADDVHLVLSCTADERHLADATSCFQGAGVSSLILTKLDEVAGLGGVFPILRASQFPLSYLTDGQDVPEDIQIASARRVADSIVGLTRAA